ncbi:CYTH and CHAD domain-containing protein [Quatrionicoccus australiensis]|uniref:CYTH and CHAD domain-containing protein n=1 Tax=Quatrionicoccus australiensis TaxID=138118 RepID=UPI001CF921AD|nr:CYTH and CHAD domain-containing protein [Quatrionicoccus australiensis]UCV14052.1 CHAD domain-containing protein [Quatrionicoccus australiensis]
MATEVELKLYCSPEAIARVGTHPLITAGVETGPAKRLENTYYDTPDLALHQERIALRLRTTPTEKLQTVKCAAKSVAGLSARPEWETPYAGAFDFSAVDARKVRAFLVERQSSLVPVFTTSFERRTWRIDISKKIAILVMVDTGQISSGGRSLPISEVELELAQGNPEDLLDFATALSTHLALVPDDVSKAERGYQLFLNQVSAPQKASPSPVATKQSSAEAFKLLASQGMQMWQANLLGTLTSQDHEFVHQFRVSLRRINSLMKVFKPALPGPYQEQWTKRVKALSQITGDVRDLDVMRIGIVEPMLQSADLQISLHAKAALAALDEAKKEAVEQLAQLQNGGPVLLFARDLQDLDTDDFPKSLPRFAEKQLAGLHRNAVKRLSKTLKTPTPERAHRFRIALKHLRYSCEFFAPLFDNDEMLEYAKAIAGLQDAFGFINDFHVALSKMQDWVAQAAIPRETRDAIAVWHTPQAQAILADALHLAESVMSRCQPWCTECERRGLTEIRRRMQRDIKLQVE